MNYFINNQMSNEESIHPFIRTSTLAGTVDRRASVLDAAAALASLGNTPIDARKSEAALPQHTSEKNGTLQSGASSLRSDISFSFPEKLMQILSNDQLTDVVAWLPHGRGFSILQKQKFADVMPQYFRQSKFTSFTRKLKRWGFTRVTSGPEYGAYYHKLFNRDNPELCMQMHCQSSSPPKGSSPGRSARELLKKTPKSKSANTSPRKKRVKSAIPSPLSSVDESVDSSDADEDRGAFEASQVGWSHADSSAWIEEKSEFGSVVDDQLYLLHLSNVAMRGFCKPRILNEGFHEIHPPATAERLAQPSAPMSRSLRFLEQSAVNGQRNCHDFDTEDVSPPMEFENVAFNRTNLPHDVGHSMKAQLKQLEELNTRVENALKNSSSDFHLQQPKVTSLEEMVQIYCGVSKASLHSPGVSIPVLKGEQRAPPAA